MFLDMETIMNMIVKDSLEVDWALMNLFSILLASIEKVKSRKICDLSLYPLAKDLVANQLLRHVEKVSNKWSMLHS